MNLPQKSGRTRFIIILIEEPQKYIVRSVNSTMVFTYFQIGIMIVEDEQKGKECAAYASETLKNLGMYLTEREEVKSITHNVNIYLQSLHFYLQSKFLEPKNIKVDSLNQF